MIFSSRNYYGPMMFMGEQAITGAIKYVTSETIPTVYLLTPTAKKAGVGLHISSKSS